MLNILFVIRSSNSLDLFTKYNENRRKLATCFSKVGQETRTILRRLKQMLKTDYRCSLFITSYEEIGIRNTRDVFIKRQGVIFLGFG